MQPTPSTALAQSHAWLERTAKTLSRCLVLLCATALAVAAVLVPLATLPEAWLPLAAGLAGLWAVAWIGAAWTLRKLQAGLGRQSLASAQAELLAQLSEQTDQALVVSDLRRRIIWTNEAFTRQSGYSFEEARGKTAAELLGSLRICPMVQQTFESALASGGSARAELLRRGKDGDAYWVEVSAHDVLDARGQRLGFVDREHLAGPAWKGTAGADAGPDSSTTPSRAAGRNPDFDRVLAAIAGRRLGSANEEEASPRVAIDALTGLGGRAFALERLDKALKHAQRHAGFGHALLVIGMHRLEQVREAFGPEAGDRVVSLFTERLQDTLRPGDLLVRLGDDCFAALLEGVHDELDAVTVTERVLSALDEPAEIQGRSLQTGGSVGLALPQPGDGAVDLLERGQVALAEAMKQGRRRWVRHDAALQARAAQAMAIEAELRQALASQQLFVVYQPVVHLRNRQWASVEALVRWRHPQLGVVLPAEFIPVAEESGLIDALGDFVLRTACTQFAGWQQLFGREAPAMLSVNMSPAQLRQPGLAAEVEALLDELGLHPQQLQIEITESLSDHDTGVQANLQALKKQGVRLALDDFGTGYSSLAGLHELPIDCVKIDRSFVQHAPEVEHHRVLIEATIRVTRTLGMVTVAEGVETEAQAALMLELGCDRAQGWLFGRPMEADALRDSLSQASADTVT